MEKFSLSQYGRVNTCAACGKPIDVGYAESLEQALAGQIFHTPEGYEGDCAAGGKPKSLAKMKVKDLRALADEHGIERRAKATKAELIAALEANGVTG